MVKCFITLVALVYVTTCIGQNLEPCDNGYPSGDLVFTNFPEVACVGDTITYSVNNSHANIYYWKLPYALDSLALDENFFHGIEIHGTWKFAIHSELVNRQYRYANNFRHDYSVVYKPNLPVSGEYKVYISYFVHPNNSSQVPVSVKCKTGIKSIIVNQRLKPENGIWHELGTFPFDRGLGGYVSIGTNGSGKSNTIADAVRFVAVSVADDTSFNFIAEERLEGTQICVSAYKATCPELKSVCTDIVHLGGPLKKPFFLKQENTVCTGKSYEFEVNDIGVKNYSWILPEGMSINGRRGVVSGQKNRVIIKMNEEQIQPVRIGVFGTLTPCMVLSDTMYTSDINFKDDLCRLETPVFLNDPLSLCVGNSVVVRVSEIANAEEYEWLLPYGLFQSGTMKNGYVKTKEPQITLESNLKYSETLEKISVRAIASDLPASHIAYAENNIMVVEAPIFEILTDPTNAFDSIDNSYTVCPSVSNKFYSSIRSKDYIYQWTMVSGSFDFTGEDSSSVITHWNGAPEGNIKLSMMNKKTLCARSASLNLKFSDVVSPEIECKKTYQVFADYDIGGLFYTFSSSDKELIPLAKDLCSPDNMTFSFSITENDWMDVSDLEYFRLNTEKGRESLHWRVTDEEGNQSFCSTEIHYKFDKLIPAAFSPNFDGINDYWQIDFLAKFPNCMISVFNRIGLKVFESNKGYTTSWNGKQNGVLVPVDTYYYVIKLGENQMMLKGLLSVMY